MSTDILQTGDGFWNIRGTFRAFGLVDVGTQASLVRRAGGGFLLLDSWTLTDAQKRAVHALTDGGAAIEAILNLHPFHTLHCEAMHRDFPAAKLYGTRRHLEKLPHLPWQDGVTEDPETQALFAEDLDFFVPRGTVFIPENDRLHFASVQALHRASRTLHVDDTLMFIRPPALLRAFGMRPRVAFHPTLRHVLEPRAGAAEEFRAWAMELAEANAETKTLCAAHMTGPFAPAPGEKTIRARILAALKRVEPILADHARKHR
ncbi:hypothetical protein [Tropicimonas sp. IMCC6043]|uniref:hypothetical protein n=1 Tax=Tropicimonas sp. IMCC6043 TaxID=2510645 RepID=UPI00101C75B5|nr:hypothetical protein [Tropicimonas sp. IMCC6043]RYH09286.1 hypothetical protein EU800_12755 [Tropicimonas sp. IMCC6043]